jgi:hypothetical protein
MSEQKPEKKVVNRTIAIALGIICIFLVLALIGAIWEYTSVINDKNYTISSLNDTVNLSKSMVWVNQSAALISPDSYHDWHQQADYAGYVEVYVQTTTPTSFLYVQVIYQTLSHGIGYDNQIYLPFGLGGLADFPVLPATIDIRVGNANLTSTRYVTVTITYHY